MIAGIAYKFVTSAWGRYIVLALGVLAAVTAYGRARARAGKLKERDQIKKAVQAQTERGHDAYHENRREAAGGSVDDALERLRGRDDHWSRMPDLW